MAPIAGYSRSTVANVETGRQHVPRDFWERCDAALGTGDALAAGFDDVEAEVRRGHEQTATLARQNLAATTSLWTPASELSVPGPPEFVEAVPGFDHIELVRRGLDEALSAGAVTGRSLDEWEQTVARYGRVTRDRPAALLVAELAVDLAELRGMIGSSHAASSLRRLTRVTAQMSGLMSLLFVKLDEPSAFRRWARTARLAASEADNADTSSWVLAQEAYGHYYAGDLAEAADVARHAQDLANSRPGVGAAMAAALEARVCGAQGDRLATRGALAQAEAVLSGLDAESVSASAFGYTESQLRFHESNAYTNLHDTKAALKAQERALQLCPRSDYTDWAMTRLDHARCLADDGDAAGAVSYASKTLADLSGQQRQGIIALRGREIMNGLPERYQAVPAVRELRELTMPAEPAKKTGHR